MFSAVRALLIQPADQGALRTEADHELTCLCHQIFCQRVLNELCSLASILMQHEQVARASKRAIVCITCRRDTESAEMPIPYRGFLEPDKNMPT